MLVQELDLTDPEIAAQVLALQKAAYRIEADLIGSFDIPQLHETLDQLMAIPVQWCGINDGGRLVAAIAFAVADGDIDIDRLVVAPDALRRGYGSALLAALDVAATVTVSTGTLNGPAKAFYLSHGFVEHGRSRPVPSIEVTHLVRRPQ
ncbi:MAG: GNAT family N-acetyltransferase [bacterium]|nr:GNAT family N-acetyltransferase [bacterium]